MMVKPYILDFHDRSKGLITSLLPLTSVLLMLALNAMGVEFLSYAILFIGLLVLGLPHGAMDHILEKRSASKLLLFLGGYVIKSIAFFFLWKFSPYLGLIIFLLYSFLHFGQSDFEEWRLPAGVRSFFWGTTLLSFMLFSHQKETEEILWQIFQYNADIKNFFIAFPYGLELSSLLLIISLFWIRKKEHLFSVITLVLSIWIPLLQAFGIYFIFQHSLTGWIHIKKGLNKSNRELWLNALPFSLGAIVLFVFFFTNNSYHWTDQTGSFFIFLSCISFPHVINMYMFYTSKSHINADSIH